MENQQIVDYIKRSKQAGMEDSAIRQALLGSGFSVQEIEESFQSMGSIGLPLDDNQPVQKPGSSSNLSKKLLKIFGILIFAIVIVVGGYYALINYLPQYAEYVQPYLGPFLDPMINSISGPSTTVLPTITPVVSSTPMPTYTPDPAPMFTPQPPQVMDSDNDGLSDGDEARYGTNPNKPDTDGDGWPDGEEVQNGYNPLGPGRASPSPLPSPSAYP